MHMLLGCCLMALALLVSSIAAQRVWCELVQGVRLSSAVVRLTRRNCLCCQASVPARNLLDMALSYVMHWRVWVAIFRTISMFLSGSGLAAVRVSRCIRATG